MTTLDLILIVVGLWLLLFVSLAGFFLYRGWQRRRSAPLRQAGKGQKDLYPTW